MIYHFHRTSRSLQRSRLLENLEVAEGVNPEVDKLIEEKLDNQSVEWLQTKLRQTPYWAKGHLELAKHSLTQNDIACAYASAHAVCALSQKAESNDVAQHILAQCYLRKGAPARSVDILNKLILKGADNQHSINEDLAAAYLALGNYSDAHSVIKRIPEDKISAEGRAALSYLKAKEN